MAGVVDQNIDPSVCRQDVVAQSHDVAFLTNIAYDRGRRAARLPDLVGDWAGGVLVYRGDDDMRAVIGEQLGGRCTDATATAGDNGDAIFEKGTVTVGSCLLHLRRPFTTSCRNNA